MNATVTARVPVEIKKQVDSKLKRMGSSPTELINMAYEYVLAHDELPSAPALKAAPQNSGASKVEVKALPCEQAAQMHAFWEQNAILGESQYDGSNFKELLEEARGEHYARFA